MKTAEEIAFEHGAWLPESGGIHGYCEFSAESFIDLVKEIQLDAYKEGMTKAVEVVKQFEQEEYGDAEVYFVSDLGSHGAYEQGIKSSRERIEVAHDNTTTL